MENLTAEFKGTSLDGIIQALYFGSLDDYVKCLECNRVSQRTDDFLVVPLPIRNFGSLLPNPTLVKNAKLYMQNLFTIYSNMILIPILLANRKLL